MTFDEERYAQQVLEPARLADGAPAGDLLARYQLTLPLSVAQVAETLPAVLACWRRARRELKFRKAVTRLEADHARLAPAFEKAKAGDLGPLQAALAEAAARGADRLGGLAAEVDDIAGPVKRITPEAANELAAHHAIQPGQIAAVLLDRGVRVSEPDPLPPQAPVAAYGRYREALRTLGCRHAADFVFGFGDDHAAQDGRIAVWDTVALADRPERRISDETVGAADRAWAARPHDGSKTLASTVLVALKGLLESSGPAGVSELVRYEVAEELRARHRQGASANALVAYASNTLGLADDDARRMAFAVRAEPANGGASAPPTATPPATTPPAAPPPAPAPPATVPAPALSPAGPLSATPPATPAASTTATGTPAGATTGPPAEVAPGRHRAAEPAAKLTHGDEPSRDAPRPAAPDHAAQPVSPAAHAPLAAYAPLPAPADVSADRAGDEVVVRWQWPTELTEVAVRWQIAGHPWRERLVSRGAYRSQGGAWLPLGEVASNGAHNAPMEITLAPMAPLDGHRVEGPPLRVRIPGRVEAWYEVTRTGPPWRRELTVAVTAGAPARLRRLMVVLRRGTVMPLHASDGEVLRQLDHVTLAPDQPVRLRLPAPRGPYWVRCFAADDSVELRDPPVVQLRGR
ncbi:MAG: hypothetical protein GEU94_00805 [Micromonosporaceae bacterium]|nr:hypothetical protein [Micromonosporaceae bacterium]